MRIRRLATFTFGLAVLISGIPMQTVQATHVAGVLLPDMGMDRVRNFSIDTLSMPGIKMLRFTTIMINIGDGPMEVRGTRSGDTMLTDQRIYSSDGTFTTEPSPIGMHYAGDAHSHWHITDLASYELFNDADVNVGTSDKQGFCLFDNYAFNLALPDAPQSPVYSPDDICGTATSQSVTTGLSVGWGDRYLASLPTQFIDISLLPTGDYTLTATVDADGLLHERCEGNNATSTSLHIDATLNTVTVNQQGTASQACPRVEPTGATYVPLTPARLLDSRVGNGLSGKFTGGVPRTFQVSGRGGVAAGATAVTGNFTVTNQNAAGAAFLGPNPLASPPTSTLNFPLGDTRANGVTVALSGSGSLSATYLAAAGKTTDFIFDVTGYFDAP